MAAFHLHTQLHHLEAMLQSGVALDSGCRALAEDRSPGPDRMFWQSLGAALGTGEPVHRALGQAFPRLPVWVADCIQAGEEAGQTGAMVGRVAEILEVAHRWRRRLLRRLAYPALILHMAALLPALPLWVQHGQAVAFLWLAGVLTMIYLPAAAVVFLGNAIRSSPGMHETVTRIVSRWPVIGPCWCLPGGSRCLAVLGVQAAVGVRWEDAIHRASRASGFPLLEKRAGEFQAHLEEGKSITTFLTALRFFPAEIINEIRTGELTGRIDRSLLHAAGRSMEIAEDRLQALGIVITVLAYVIAVFLVLAAGVAILGPVYWQVYQLL